MSHSGLKNQQLKFNTYFLSDFMEIISLIYIQKIEKDKEKTSPSKLGRICM